MRRITEVGSVQDGKQKTRPGWNQKADDPAEEELETARAWLCDRDLTMDD